MIPAAPEFLAQRLGLASASPEVLAKLDEVLTVSAGLIDPHTDPDLVDRNPLIYLEAVYQLAVKLVDLGTKGAVDFNVIGDVVMPNPSATAGLVRSVWGLLQPLSLSGGLTV